VCLDTTATCPSSETGKARYSLHVPDRLFARVLILGALFIALGARVSPQAQPGTLVAPGGILPPWSPGTLDIHQIATGRGNSALTIFPDGTTMLVDAGDAGETPFADQRPNATRTPGQWIARYVRHMLEGRAQEIDYAVLTHFHPDHMGRISGNEPMSANGDYRLSGITQVAEDVPIRRLIDRGSPDYTYLPPPSDAMFTNYRRFTAANVAAKRMTVMGAQAGSVTQIVPVRGGASAVPFEVRVVSANDRVWTSRGTQTAQRFPALDTITVPEDRPTENMCSVTLRITYGNFSYFTGGDMPGYPVPGAPAWHDTETAVAKAIGPTDVHVVNHHGSIEEENPFWLATLKSRVMVLPAWSATHPSADVLKRMLSRRLYPEERDIFVSIFRPETKAAIGARASQVASDHGHIVIRVEPGGGRYRVFVLDDTTETYRVRSVHGPYRAD
jgi:beta-lactamase superfamily II metal-dependent hydrolase